MAFDSSVTEALQSWIGEREARSDLSSEEQVARIIDDYDVVATVKTILAEQFEGTLRVALQFPDHLLPDAPIVCETLRLSTEQVLEEEAETGLQVFYFLLGDTSYGECCVDEVAAQHLGADLVVHYGNACLSPTQSLPVLYVFPRYRFEDGELARRRFENAVRSVASAENVDRVIILYDMDLDSCFENEGFRIDSSRIEYDLGSLQKEICPARLRIRDVKRVVRPGDDSRVLAKSELPIGALSVDLGGVSLSRTGFLWITQSESLEDLPAAIRNAALQMCTGPEETCAGFFASSLTSETDATPAVIDGSRILRKRFAVLSKVKDAERIGIVPGTLGISGNLEVIERCKRIVQSVEKRSYIILVGKPNPSKLGNFAEIDVFVLVACPQNALLNGRDYLRPIVTPLELEAALLADGDLFSRPYSVDFRDMLENELALEDDEVESTQADGDSTAIAKRGEWGVQVAGPGGAAEFLQSRLWRGLVYNTGGADETDISELSTKAEMGQTGIASRYDGEP